ncbi:MAG: enoyl-ACP reductase FabI [Actinomycetota bacterium]
MLLDGKRLLITGVVTTDSIAYATAAAAVEAGARIVLSALGRDLERTHEAANELGDHIDVLEADLTEPDHIHRLADNIRGRWGELDGLLHAVAFAPREALSGDFLEAGSESVSRAMNTSVHSYAVTGRMLRDLAPPEGGSLVGLDFDSAKAWPVYNWMGVAKSALESANRYVARDLGPRRIRANLIAAGPLHTRAASGIAGFEHLTNAWDHQSPLPWDAADARPVGDAAVFLFSDLARMISGEILHVDGGFHAMAAHLDR